MAKKLMVFPPAELPHRDGDVELTPEQFLTLSLFTGLKRKPGLDKFPGAIRLRRYKAGEVVCRQGEAGFTAFYILTSEDVLALEKRPAQGGEPGTRRALTACLAIPRPSRRPAGPLTRLARRLFDPAQGEAPRQPLYIPMDGPTDIDYESRQAALYEGEVFGEMSCLRRAPRSATVVADRDCHALEMLRNIFDALYKDDGYRARTDASYKQRVLEMHLRNLPLFAGLSNTQLEELRDAVQLVSYESGEVIWDEHDPSDSLCVIRSGVVRVMTGVSPWLGAEDVADWPAFRAALRQGEGQPATPAGRVWQELTEEARASADAAPVFRALNALIGNRGLSEAAEFQPVVTAASFRERAREWPADRKSWSERQARQYNRLLLEAVFPGHLGRPPRTLAYCSRGEPIGEMGLILGHPRSASCLAAGHPNDEGGRVELVRISADLFAQLRTKFADFDQQVADFVGPRQQRSLAASRAAPWDDGRTPLLSAKAAELGLVQGQRLMLIDLDRCTRCDECVRACVNTHEDGQSRLFLSGERFGPYLVPFTCRSCLDPVCMMDCPVGAIHRGNNGEIRIENWCIGCEKCAKDCPYGSIHMGDLGLIPEEADGWRYTLAALAGGNWKERGAARDWAAGRAPFHFDRDFAASLPGGVLGDAPAGVPICFAYEFQVPAELLRDDSRFTLELTSVDPTAAVWMNGKELKTADKPKRGKREYEFVGQDLLRPARLFAGRNVVAAQVTGVPGSAEVLFGLRLDEVRRPNVPHAPDVEVTEKAVTHRAVVCDLCSDQPGQVPACVNACPHDAALRVEARQFTFGPR